MREYSSWIGIKRRQWRGEGWLGGGGGGGGVGGGDDDDDDDNDDDDDDDDADDGVMFVCVCVFVRQHSAFTLWQVARAVGGTGRGPNLGVLGFCLIAVFVFCIQ